jgi:DNA-directed RNA polymerase subunit H (RpoH/RPB5)
MELTDWQLQRVEESLSFILSQRNSPTIVHFPVEDASNKSIVIKVSNAILSQSAKDPNFIIILHVNQYNRSGLLHELLDELFPRDYSKVFFIDELVSNPIANKMVSQHELCTKRMVERLLQKYSITVDALPKILLRDPIVRWYGWEVGDVVKITRPNGELYYRMVIG